MPDTNLQRGFDNTYYRVTAAFSAYVAAALCESNTFVGRSQALGTVWRPVELRPGDTVLALVGGTFLLRAGADRAVPVRHGLPTRHLFERGGNRDTDWPLHNLAPAERPDDALTYHDRGDMDRVDADRLRSDGARLCEDGIDWVLQG